VDDDELDVDVADELERLRSRAEAARLFAAEQHAKNTHAFALPDPARTFADDLAEPDHEQKYTIDGLHTKEGNTLLAAAYKTGKSTLAMNVAKALADDEPFLGEFETDLTGRVALLNYEMNSYQYRAWLRDIGIENIDAMAAPLHLRGYALPFWNPEWMKRVCDWLEAQEVGFLIADPATSAWRGLVLDSNSNDQVAAFTHALNEVKRVAGVQDLLLTHHLGRKVHEEGAEHSRGATALEDWADALWYLTKDKDDVRSLRAAGRDVSLPAIELSYDAQTRTMSSTGLTRKDAKDTRHVVKALQALSDMLYAKDPAYPPNTTTWRAAIKGDKTEREEWMKAAISAGYVERVAGTGKALLNKLTPDGFRVVKQHEAGE
jgi:RecA-family ATPase